MGTLNRAFTAIRQKITNGASSKRKTNDDHETSSSKRPRLIVNVEPSQHFPNTEAVGPSEANTMDIDSSDGEDEFINAHEQIQDEPIFAGGAYESSFFTDALEEITSSSNGDMNEALESTEQPPSELDDQEPDSPANSQDPDTSSTSSASDSPEPPGSPDLFSSTFGQDALKSNDDDGDDDDDYEHSDPDLEILNEDPKPPIPNSSPTQPSLREEPSSPKDPSPSSLFLQTLSAQGYSFSPCEHTANCSCDHLTRLPTPPLAPLPYIPVTFPTLPGSISRDLLEHQRWHARARTFIPKLSLRDTFDAGRRYWIAVVLQGRRPDRTAGEREYVWMKGNRFSTVSTVWHHFQTTTMADPDDLVLMLGRTRPGMGEQMRGLDYFGDRLVVFRAVGKGHPDARERGLVDGLEREVIELD